MESVGKGGLVLAIFPPHVGCLRTGFGPGTQPYQEVKSPHGLCWAGHHAWEYLSLRFNVFSTVLLKHVQYMASGQLHCDLHHSRRGQAPSTAAQKACMHQLSEGTCWPWGTNTHCRSWSCSVPPLHPIQCFSALCFPWWLQYQDAVGKRSFELLLWIKWAIDATCSTGSNNPANYPTFALLVMWAKICPNHFKLLEFFFSFLWKKAYWPSFWFTKIPSLSLTSGLFSYYYFFLRPLPLRSSFVCLLFII